MAFEVPGRTIGYKVAGADLSASQYRFIKGNSSGQFVRCDTIGEIADGVVQNKPKATEAVTCMVDGTSKVEAGAAIALGAFVTTDAVGRAITAGVGNQRLGRAALAAGAAGEIISVELHRLGPA